MNYTIVCSVFLLVYAQSIWAAEVDGLSLEQRTKDVVLILKKKANAYDSLTNRIPSTLKEIDRTDLKNILRKELAKFCWSSYKNEQKLTKDKSNNQYNQKLMQQVVNQTPYEKCYNHLTLTTLLDPDNVEPLDYKVNNLLIDWYLITNFKEGELYKDRVSEVMNAEVMLSKIIRNANQKKHEWKKSFFGWFIMTSCLAGGCVGGVALMMLSMSKTLGVQIPFRLAKASLLIRIPVFGASFIAAGFCGLMTHMIVTSPQLTNRWKSWTYWTIVDSEIKKFSHDHYSL